MRALPFVFFIVAAVLLLLPILRRRRIPSTSAPAPLDELVKDPVCQTYVVRSRAVRRPSEAGPRYFCSAECARRHALETRG